jgi:hypothetical protein
MVDDVAAGWALSQAERDEKSGIDVMKGRGLRSS